MADSLILFEQWDLYTSLAAYVRVWSNEGILLKDWVPAYFSDMNGKLQPEW